MFVPVVLAPVVPDEDGQRGANDEGQLPVRFRSQTPPTPPVQAASPPACTRPLRQRAMAQLRPVSIPEIVRDKRWLLIAFGTPESIPKLLASLGR